MHTPEGPPSGLEFVTPIGQWYPALQMKPQNGPKMPPFHPSKLPSTAPPHSGHLPRGAAQCSSWSLKTTGLALRDHYEIVPGSAAPVRPDAELATLRSQPARTAACLRVSCDHTSLALLVAVHLHGFDMDFAVCQIKLN